MSIPLNALYIIPLVMVLVATILLFKPVKTKDVEDTGMMVAMFMGVCGIATLLCLAIFAFGMVCKVFC